MNQTPLVRPFWDESEYHRELWRERDITVLITQNKSLDITRLTLESLLTFYPDIPVFVVNNSPDDVSADYLHYKASKIPNLTIWDRTGLNSHGESMNEAMRDFIKTKYVLAMDSDVIVHRGGWIEQLLKQMKKGIFATGTLMLVTNRGDACGPPLEEADILRYAHPSCAVYDREIYLTLRPFCNHGAPCYRTMQDAQKQGLQIGYFPIEYYVSHLSGASWCVPRTIWKEDYNVKLRPLVTFITSSMWHISPQIDMDYDIISPGSIRTDKVIIHDGEPEKEVSNTLYQIRFNVLGDYVCELNKDIDTGFVIDLREEVTNNDADIITVQGVECYKRGYWQYRKSLI